MWRNCRCGGAIALAVIALSAALAASAAGALSMKACELLTLRDVQGVLGSGYTQQAVLENQIMSVCGYSKSGGNGVNVSLKQEIYDSAQLLKMEQEGIKQQGGAVTPLDGLGAYACYVIDDKGTFLLSFGKGNQHVILSVLTDGKPNVDAAQRLAKIAYPRLR